MKAQPKPSEAMTAQMVLSALIGLPGLIWTGLPAQESWPWIAGSTALNLVTITALLRAYDLIGFGTAEVAGALAGAVNAGGSETITLTGGTTIVFQGFTGLTSASFL